MEEEPLSNNQQDVCKICREEGSIINPLFNPCSCIGSIGKIHESCLYRWIISKSNIENPSEFIEYENNTKRIFFKKKIDIKCDICKQPYNFKVVQKNESLKDISLKEYFKPLINKLSKHLKSFFYLLLLFISVVVIVPHYWVFCKAFYQNIADYLIGYESYKNKTSIWDTGYEKHAVEKFIILNEFFTSYPFIGKLIQRIYSGLLDIVFFCLVAASLFFTQDLITSELVFKEMVTQDMGKIDIIDCTKVLEKTAKDLAQILKTRKFNENFSQDLVHKLQSEFNFIEDAEILNKLIDRILAYEIPKYAVTWSNNYYQVSEELLKLTFINMATEIHRKLYIRRVMPVAWHGAYSVIDEDFAPEPEDIEFARSHVDGGASDSDEESEYVPHSSEEDNIEDDTIEDDIIEEDIIEDVNREDRVLEYINELMERQGNENNMIDADFITALQDAVKKPNATRLRQQADSSEQNDLNRQFVEALNQRAEHGVMGNINDEDNVNNIGTIFKLSLSQLPKQHILAFVFINLLLFLFFFIPYLMGTSLVKIIFNIDRGLINATKIFGLQIQYSFPEYLEKNFDLSLHPVFQRVIPCTLFYMITIIGINSLPWYIRSRNPNYTSIPISWRGVYQYIFLIKQTTKAYCILSTELLIFPIASGMMVDFSLVNALLYPQSVNRFYLPKYESITEVFFVYRVLGFLPKFIQVIAHAALGTLYMYSIAGFVGMIRAKVLRKGVLYFIRSPEDPNRKILRDCLVTGFGLQVRKLLQSMMVYTLIIVFGLGLSTRMLLPLVLNVFNKENLSIITIRFLKHNSEVNLNDTYYIRRLTNLLILVLFVPGIYPRFKENHAKIANLVTKVWNIFFVYACSKLRLSHYMLNKDEIQERGYIVYRNLNYKLFNKKQAQFSNINLYTNPKTLEDANELFKTDQNVHCYFIPDGDFYRVPGSDIISTKFLRTLFVTVTRTDKVIHRREVREKIGFRGQFDNLIVESNLFDKYDVIYSPPKFFKRSMLLVAFINLYGMILITSILYICNLLGNIITYVINNFVPLIDKNVFNADSLLVFMVKDISLESILLGLSAALYYFFDISSDYNPEILSFEEFFTVKIPSLKKLIIREVFIGSWKMSSCLIVLEAVSFTLKKLFGYENTVSLLDNKNNLVRIGFMLLYALVMYLKSLYGTFVNYPDLEDIQSVQKIHKFSRALYPNFMWMFCFTDFLPIFTIVFSKMFILYEKFSLKNTILTIIGSALFTGFVRFSKHLVEFKKHYKEEVLFEGMVLEDNSEIN
ncbi:E3 ubiquitin-protein ligase [Hanseniaspora uvarum]|nr:E3 ubiquitin-protein ligase [Hanseniaspora uvarum]